MGGGQRKRVWSVVSTHLKNISQNGNLPQFSGVKIPKIFEVPPPRCDFWWVNFQAILLKKLLYLPIIMIQWKIAIFEKILLDGTQFSLNHGRKGIL